MYIYIYVYTTFTYIFSNYHVALLPRWDDGPESPMYYQDVPTGDVVIGPGESESLCSGWADPQILPVVRHPMLA